MVRAERAAVFFTDGQRPFVQFDAELPGPAGSRALRLDFRAKALPVVTGAVVGA
jgi:hypothetical protein